MQALEYPPAGSSALGRELEQRMAGIKPDRQAGAWAKRNFALTLSLGMFLQMVSVASVGSAPVLVQPGTVVIHLFFPVSLLSVSLDAGGMAARCGNQVVNGLVQATNCMGR